MNALALGMAQVAQRVLGEDGVLGLLKGSALAIEVDDG